jgi:DNA adenine methylase
MPLALCKYQGGKRQLAQRLIPLIPPHITYVEPFCGAAAIFFNKPPSPVEVLNDINTNLVNAFRCMRYHGQSVIEELVFCLGSRQELSASRKCSTCESSPQTDIQRAAAFLFERAISFGSDGQSFGVQKRKRGGAATSLVQVRKSLESVRARLDGVIIENLDWPRCLALYDSPETFFFCDPPYIGGQQKAYASWTIAEFARLLSALKSLKGKWMLTINDHAEVRPLLRGLRIRRMLRARALNMRSGGHQYAELCIVPRL